MEEDQIEQEDIEEEETPDEEKKPSPALTINIQSWWTPIVGGILLVVGLLAGYFLRPMITPDALADAGGSSSAPAPTTAPQPTVDPESHKQLMDFLLPQVKHFKGDACPGDADRIQRLSMTVLILSKLFLLPTNMGRPLLHTSMTISRVRSRRPLTTDLLQRLSATPIRPTV